MVVVHVWRLMSLAWLALSIQWAGESVWGQAAFTAAVGVVCYAAGERYQATGT